MSVDVAALVTDLVDQFNELNDDPFSQFGELARVTAGSDWLKVLHQHEPYGVVITIRQTRPHEESR